MVTDYGPLGTILLRGGIKFDISVILSFKFCTALS